MVNQVALNLFGFPIYWYGILIASAVVLGVIVASAREKRLGFKKDTTLDFLLLALPLAVSVVQAHFLSLLFPALSQYISALYHIFPVFTSTAPAPFTAGRKCAIMA